MGKKEVVLLVEDNEAIRMLIETVLRKGAGHSVIACACPLDALDILKEKESTVGLVITDMLMPKMRGDKLCSLIKSLYGELPVVLCTSVDIVEAKDLSGFDKFLKKPFSISSIIAVVQEYIPVID